jgi:hypothetical protein
MQSIAVLILEMAYRNGDKESSEPSMVVSIKKLIRWLRAMQHTDPVAARAHHVIREVLERCAPALKSQANELLALYEERTPEHHAYQHYHHHHIPHSAQQTAQVPQGNFHLDPRDIGGTFDPQPVQHDALDNLPAYQGGFDPLYPPHELTATMNFGSPFFTHFDYGTPFVNMQDLWVEPGPSSSFDPNLPYGNTSRTSRDGEHGQNTGYAPQQQKFDYYPSQE